MRALALTVSVLALAAVSLHAADAPKPRKAQQPAKPTPAARSGVPPRITGVSPTEARPGEKITIHGMGLDQGSTVLIGSFAPRVVETAADRIVVALPGGSPKNEGEPFEVFLITPGSSVTPSGFRVKILPRDDPRFPVHPITQAKGLRAVVEEEITLPAGKPKRYELDVPKDDRLVVTVKTKPGSGTEVETSIGVAGKPKPTTTRATYGGSLIWKVNSTELTGEKEMTDDVKAVATLSADVDVPVSVKLTLHEKSTPNAVRPKS